MHAPAASSSTSRTVPRSSSSVIDLRGKTALVTGASRGIGYAVARAFTGVGMRTWMLARTPSQLHHSAHALGKLAIAEVCDVSDVEAVRITVARIAADCNGAPDVVVNNAGLFPLAAIEDTSVEEFASALNTNLLAPFHLTRAFLPAMRTRGSGHNVLIGSVADRSVFPGNASYAATKFGSRALHEVLRMETLGSGVRSSLVSPSATDTSIWDAVDPDNREGFTKREAMLRTDAVADAVLWVVSRPPEVNIDELRLSRA